MSERPKHFSDEPLEVYEAVKAGITVVHVTKISILCQVDKESPKLTQKCQLCYTAKVARKFYNACI